MPDSPKPDPTDALMARASRASQAVRAELDNVPSPSLRVLHEAASSSTEINLLVLQRIGHMDAQLSELKRRLDRQESAEQRATEVLLAERRSQFGLQEEVTRTELYLRKARSERWGQIITRALAVCMTPPGVWAVWKWVTSMLG